MLKKYWCSPITLFIVALMVTLPLAMLIDIPERDVANRYATMADAFAAGEWNAAFHPRIPFLFPTASGVIAFLFGCGGFMATKLAACLFFAAGVFPLYGIFKRVFDIRIAGLGCLLYVFCSHLLRLASSGFRDSAKGFAFFLALYGLIVLFQERKRLAGYCWCCGGAALLILTRGDCLLYAALFMLAALTLEFRCEHKFQWPWRSLVGGFILLLIISPTLTYNYRTIGYPVTEVRFGVILNGIEQKIGHEFVRNKNVIDKIVVPRVPPGAPRITGHAKLSSSPLLDEGESIYNSNEDMNSIPVFILSVFKGLYPYFFCLALPVIIWRMIKRHWRWEETILLTALLGHGLLLVLQIAIFDHYLYVSRRYLLPIAPLAFGWAAIMLIIIFQKLSLAYPNIVTRCSITVIGILAGLGLWADAVGPVLKSYTSEKKSRERQATLAIAAWIKADYDGPRRIERQARYFNYCSDRRPVIDSNDLHVVGYLAGGQNIAEDDPDFVAGTIKPDYLIISGKKHDAIGAVAGFHDVKNFDIGGAKYWLLKREGK